MIRWLRSRLSAARSSPDLDSGSDIDAPGRDTGPHGPEGHIGHRRRDCWWEPIYAPDLKVQPIPYDWEMARDSGPSRSFISGSSLKEKVVPGDTFKVEDVTFKECDFQGRFRPETLIMFDRCHFIGCDFAYSSWKDAHFRSCTFADSSISLAAFERCEFRDCKWERIGFGSKTELVSTFINNPDKMITASVSNLNPKDRSLKHRLYQWYRLRGTRAHFLRSLMISHQVVGDEHTYYATVRLHELQCSTSRICYDCFDFLFSKTVNKTVAFVRLLLHTVDYVILRSFGWLNKWGSSVSQPCLVLATSFLLFGLIYRKAVFDQPISRPFQKSFDITLLVGYGNQVRYEDHLLTIVQDVQALMSVVIYSVFFATVISKLSRAR